MVSCGEGPGVSSLEGFDEAHITVGGQQLTVMVADRPETRQQGLMEVDELPRGVDGMLFVFESPAPVSFHMRNTHMELDIWWFDHEGVLIGSNRMEPCPEEPCVMYRSPGPILWALETPVAGLGFQPGDVLSTGESG